MKKHLILRTVSAVLLSLLLIVPMLTTALSVFAADNATVAFNNPAIPANAGQTVDLTRYSVEFSKGSATAASSITWTSSELAISSGKVTPSSKGVYKLTATSDSKSKTVYLVVKNEADTEYVLYYNDFSSANSIDDWVYDSTSANGTQHSVQDGKLKLDCTSHDYDGGRIYLPEWLGDFGNYTVKSKASISNVSNNSRWMAFMYRVQPAGNAYFQFAIRQNAAASNGAELAYKSTAGSWNYHYQGSYSSALTQGTFYDFELNVFDNNASTSINGTVAATSDAVNEYSVGRLGLHAAGSVATFDDIKVTVRLDPVRTTSIAKISPLTSNITLAPTMIFNITTAAELSEIRRSAPGVAIMTIDESCNVLDGSGAKISTVDEAVESFESKIIPAFRLADGADPQKTATAIKNLSLKECLVISANDSDLQKMRAVTPVILGVYDMSSATADTKMVDVRAKTLSAGAKVCLLPADLLTQHNVSFLNSLGVTVWCAEREAEKAEYFKLITSGVNGIICTNRVKLASAVSSDLFKKNTIIRPVSVIGHRGTPALAPENTLEGSQLAALNGANIIENDIYLTTDGKIVVMHDGTVDRTTNGSGNIESMSSTEINKLRVDIKPTTSETEFDRIDEELYIPYLYEYFDAFKGTDTFMFIEIKSGQVQRIVAELKKLIDKHDIAAQCGVISFSEDAVRETREQIPYISAGLLSSNANIDSIISKTSALGSSHNPGSGVTMSLVEQLSARGILTWPWTIRDSSSFDSFFVMGVGGITTDNSYLATDYVKYLYTDKLNYSLELGESIDIDVLAEAYGSDSETYENRIYNASKAKMVYIDGNKTVSYADGKLSATEEGEATIMFELGYKLNNGKTVYVYSQAITVDVVTPEPEAPAATEPDTTEPEATEKEGGCGSAIGAASIVLAVVAIMGAAVIPSKSKR